MRSRVAAAVLLLALSLPLTGCSSDGSDPAARGAAGAPPAGRLAAPSHLRFTAKTLDGATFDGAALAGKPVLFWFYGSACAECPAQAFETAARADRYVGRVHVVAVAEPGTGNGLQGFAAPAGAGRLPHLSDTGHALRDRFHAEGVNTYLLLDEDGEVLYKGSGAEGDKLDGELAAVASGV
ncbi:TlpA disulfide reductase family protein [Streptomyces sp. NPDC048272]|uniref:TlpA family protein disulfide reductase n=1 Tax=Streptomyces sp. NPDC048272 TaxID=3154616 RepID=UPI0034100CE4